MIRKVNCVMCEKEFETTGPVAKYCAVCKRINKNNKQNEKRQEKLAANEDNIHCGVCGIGMTNLTSHVTRIHKISMAEYSDTYGGPILSPNVTKKLSDASTGEKNAGYQHGGRLSPWSDKSKYHSPEAIAEARKKAKENYTREKRDTTLEFYLAKGMTEEEAIEARSNRQRTFTLEKCIKRYGEEKGTEIYNKRQEKWQNTLKSKSMEAIQDINRRKARNGSSTSSVETRLVNCLKMEIDGISTQQSVGIYTVDCMKDKKIIEFFGDYWHMNPTMYASDYVNPSTGLTASDKWELDKDRLKYYESYGYDVKVIWENDFNRDQNKVITECLEFLKQ